MDIGKRLKILREAKGLSQGDVERRSGLLRSYISRVEGGYTEPSLATLERFAKALSVQPYQILNFKEQKPKPLKLPDGVNLTRPLNQLVKLFQAMPEANRKILLTMADKLSKR